MLIKQVLLVGAGGFLGSVLRFTIGGWAQRLAPAGQFPLGTLAVNVIGCLLIGLLAGIAEYRQALDPAQRAFLMIGLLGGFTTFSAFALETLALAQDGEVMKAAANVVLQVVIGLFAAMAGYVLARAF